MSAAGGDGGRVDQWATANPRTSIWLAGVGEALYDRPARAGLVAARQTMQEVKLGAFLTTYMTQRAGARANTIKNLRTCLESGF